MHKLLSCLRMYYSLAERMCSGTGNTGEGRLYLEHYSLTIACPIQGRLIGQYSTSACAMGLFPSPPPLDACSYILHDNHLLNDP